MNNTDFEKEISKDKMSISFIFGLLSGLFIGMSIPMVVDATVNYVVLGELYMETIYLAISSVVIGIVIFIARKAIFRFLY